jgi:hypothetical protein
MKKKDIYTLICEAQNDLQNHPMMQHPTKPKFFHYSYLWQGGVIACGVNHFGIVPPGYPENAITHSEAHAYQKGKHKLDFKKPHEILNLRFNRLGELRMSKPCKYCMSLLLIPLGCSRVYFSTDFGVAKLEIGI